MESKNNKSRYFSHDHNSRNDPKLFACKAYFFRRYGGMQSAYAYAIFFTIIEMLAENKGEFYTDDVEAIVFQVWGWLDEQELATAKDMVSYMIFKSKLFVVDESRGIFYSQRLTNATTTMLNENLINSRNGKKSALDRIKDKLAIEKDPAKLAKLKEQFNETFADIRRIENEIEDNIAKINQDNSSNFKRYTPIPLKNELEFGEPDNKQTGNRVPKPPKPSDQSNSPSFNGAERPFNGVERLSNGVEQYSNGAERPSNGVERPSNGVERPSNGVPPIVCGEVQNQHVIRKQYFGKPYELRFFDAETNVGVIKWIEQIAKQIEDSDIEAEKLMFEKYVQNWVFGAKPTSVKHCNYSHFKQYISQIR